MVSPKATNFQEKLSNSAAVWQSSKLWIGSYPLPVEVLSGDYKQKRLLEALIESNVITDHLSILRRAHGSVLIRHIVRYPCQLYRLSPLRMESVFLPDSPVEAKFLNEQDRLVAIERLRMNQMGVMSRIWKWDHLRESFLDIKTWFWFALIFSIS